MIQQTKDSKKKIDSLDEQIEGMDISLDDGLGDYPIDTLMIRTENRTVFEVVRRIKSGGFIMNPDFQRDFVWDLDKQSKLIESVLLRIPLPVFYLAENKKGQTIVVDGLQRLSTFKAYMDDEFALKLPRQINLNKKHFSQLAPKLKNRIEDCNLVLYVIDSKVHEQAKLDIFERVNSGEILTRQQMRNCIYSGKATKWLKTEAHTDLFIQVTGKSLDQKKMRDREFVNRFCSFFLIGIDAYKKEMDEFLAKSLDQMNEMADAELEKLSQQFRRGLANNLNLFQEHAFRKHIEGQKERSVINASLWDVMATGLAHYSEEQVKDQSERLKEAFYKLLKNEEFNDAITYSPNSTKNVKKRFELGQAMFWEVLGAYQD